MKLFLDERGKKLGLKLRCFLVYFRLRLRRRQQFLYFGGKSVELKVTISNSRSKEGETEDTFFTVSEARGKLIETLVKNLVKVNLATDNSIAL